MTRLAAMSRTGITLAAVAICAIVAVVPLLVDPSNPADPYYGLKARTLWSLTPVLLVALLLAARDRGVRRAVPWIPLSAFVVVVAASTALGVDPRWSALGAPWRHEGALTLAAYALIGAATTAGFTRGSPHLWLAAVLAGAGVTALVGVLQFLGWIGLPLDVQRVRWHQAFSTTGNPNWLGGYAILAVPLAVAAWSILRAERLEARPVDNSSFDGLRASGWRAVLRRAAARIAEMVALTVLAVILLAGLMTLSRAAWFVLALTLAVQGLLSSSAPRAGMMRRAISPGLVAAVVVAVFLGINGVTGAAWGRMQGVVSPTGPIQQRLYLWRGTLDLVRHRPILGYGPEAFPRVFPQQWTEDRRRLFGSEPLVMDKAHNDTLDLAVSSGLLGVGAFWWVVIVCVRRAWRGRRTQGPAQPLAAASVAAVVGYLLYLQLNFSVVSVAPVFWSLLGLSATLGPERSSLPFARTG